MTTRTVCGSGVGGFGSGMRGSLQIRRTLVGLMRKDEPRLDAEKLTVYRLALDLQQLTSVLGLPTHRVLYDQLERASISIVTNLAEGAGRHSPRDKRRFYAISRGSAMEKAALIDLLRVRRLAPEAMCDKARNLALRVIQLLTKLHASLA